MTVGILRDIRSGKVDPHGVGGESIFFWAVAGCFGGGAFGFALADSSTAAVLSVLGLIAGLTIGFYAAFGSSLLAHALSVPGVFVSIVWGLFA